MKIKLVYFTIVFIVTFSIKLSFSQTPAYTWMLGSKIMNQSGDYGTKGVAASTNIPGAQIGRAHV